MPTTGRYHITRLVSRLTAMQADIRNQSPRRFVRLAAISLSSLLCISLTACMAEVSAPQPTLQKDATETSRNLPIYLADTPADFQGFDSPPLHLWEIQLSDQRGLLLGADRALITPVSNVDGNVSSSKIILLDANSGDVHWEIDVASYIKIAKVEWADTWVKSGVGFGVTFVPRENLIILDITSQSSEAASTERQVGTRLYVSGQDGAIQGEEPIAGVDKYATLFTSDYGTIFEQTADGTLSQLVYSDGALISRWSTWVPWDGYAAWESADLVYFGDPAEGFDAVLDPTTGAYPSWFPSPTSNTEPTGRYFLVDGTLIELSPDSRDEDLVTARALDDKGQTLWERSALQLAGPVSNGFFLLDGDQFSLVDPRSGESHWTTRVSATDPWGAVRNEQIILMDSAWTPDHGSVAAQVTRISLATGEVLSTITLDHPRMGFAVGEDKLLAWNHTDSGDDVTHLTAFSLADDRELWSVSYPAGSRFAMRDGVLVLHQEGLLARLG